MYLKQRGRPESYSGVPAMRTATLVRTTREPRSIDRWVIPTLKSPKLGNLRVLFTSSAAQWPTMGDLARVRILFQVLYDYTWGFNIS